ncbi:hypothetical protein LTR10_018926 [Elasticomyces elasticus]|uniref:Uncharacterized protein n=1 Tax=Exophiala sideris TaxID=1016849 RepID=A0ABR0JJ41_9EURO|nr:hypothetical protein LTR10_018926 [Elasticomyces elasticus]KAK5034429.1 hypothetical protein LTS07_003350 [Exophiala sideris]KAK5042726.1 hypothetical protein LTR13_001574 [Exophiala sideris]KAK5065809.1 hypothetical protein LTR69_003359 [Exophiala sideris]KAK5185730.1 hypothetical protein LTR44_001779 [Eurotiomycetes sp. CCFEE 6388]
MTDTKGIVVFSGGSAANNLVDVFEAVRENKACPLSYIIPISDNGGSSSELIRVFGGPGIGDVRSRLVRLIPTDPSSPERLAISSLFNHRLSSTSSVDAAAEWQLIVSGTSDLWRAISAAKTELVRSFLNLLNLEILKRARPASTFDFTSASVGNLFLTGARLFSGSFESAIYLLSSICSIPEDVRVIPSITSNFSHHIAAGLASGDVIVGQNNISHPAAATALEMPTVSTGRHHFARNRHSVDHTEETEDANFPGTLPTLRQNNIKFSKSEEEDLPARIERIWYINPYGQEMLAPANPRVIAAIKQSQAVIYSIGSLYTSIIPSIVLKGVGDALRLTPARHKILILNGSLDRETGPSSNPYSAFDFVEAITRAGEQSRGNVWRPVLHTIRSDDSLRSTVASSPAARHGDFLIPGTAPQYESQKTSRDSIYRQYVTHVIHLIGEGTPQVDRERLADLGIHCLKLYGRKSDKGVMLYDSQALIGAIEAVLGKKGDAMLLSRSRRNTIES